MRPGRTLLIAGAGASGLLHVAAACARGVESVRVIEPDPVRHARALAWGAEPHDGEPVDVAIACTSKREAIATGRGQRRAGTQVGRAAVATLRGPCDDCC